MSEIHMQLVQRYLYIKSSKIIPFPNTSRSRGRPRLTLRTLIGIIPDFWLLTPFPHNQLA